MNSLTRLLFALACCLPFMGWSTDIAITLDDHPMADGPLFAVRERTERLMAACTQHRCQTAFFCVGKGCQGDLLALVNDNGHFLANHTMTHRGASTLSLDEFEKELVEMDRLLKPYSHGQRWFRFPNLDYGNREPLGGSPEKTVGLMGLLQRHGYQEGYVSINTFDWLINGRLAQALKRGDKVDYEALKRVYLDLVAEWTRFYIELYRTHFPEAITHTLLLHANDLNALYLADLLALIKESGWRLVSPELAFADVSWRQVVFEKPTQIGDKPSSLNAAAIDTRLEQAHVFTPQN